MILNYFIADYLLKKKWPSHKVKLVITAVDTVAYLFLYFLLFRKMHNNLMGALIFLMVISVIQYFRSKKMDVFIKSRLV